MPDITSISGIAANLIVKRSGHPRANITGLASRSPNRLSLPSTTSIITDNLYQYYDASNASSYPGSGTTWTDLQGNYNVSLINGPAFESTDPKHFDFDGVNDYSRGATNYAHSSTDMTVEAWVRKDTTSAYRQSICAAFQTTTTNRRFIFNFEQYTGAARIIFTNTSANNYILTSTTTFGSGTTWYHIVGVKDGGNVYIYVDGSQENSRTFSGTLGTCNVFGIGERQLSSQDIMRGDIAKVRIYSDALSSSEVQQNYDAEKSYFGKT